MREKFITERLTVDVNSRKRAKLEAQLKSLRRRLQEIQQEIALSERALRAIDNHESHMVHGADEG